MLRVDPLSSFCSLWPFPPRADTVRRRVVARGRVVPPVQRRGADRRLGLRPCGARGLPGVGQLGMRGRPCPPEEERAEVG